MRLTVISLNIWNGKMLDACMDFLRGQSADIVLLQEVFNGSEPSLPEQYRAYTVLQDSLGYKHSMFAPAALDRFSFGKIDIGNAVFSRFPIVSTDVRFFDRPYAEREPNDPAEWPRTPRNLQHAAIDSSGVTVNVYNFQGVWDLDGDNYSEQRQNMSRIILEETQGRSNIILAGDTNAKQTNQAMRNLEKELVPVFDTGLKTTFNMRHKTNPGYATAAVDLMYVSPEFHVVSKSVPNVDISDHLPIVVELELTGEETS